MTPISEKDRNKVIILVVAVVAVFGFLFWRIMGSSAPDTKPPEVVHVDTIPTTATPSATNAVVPSAIVDMVSPTGAGQVNPFRTVLASPSSSTARPSTSIKPPSMKGNLGPVLPVVGGDVPTEEPKLTGVMSGNPPIGVFQIGTKEEILRAGETMSNGFLVQSIRGETAVLVKKKTVLRLSIGSSE